MRTSLSARAIALVVAVAISLAGWLSPPAPPPVSAASTLTALYADGGWMAAGRTLYQTATGSTWTATYDSGSGAASITIDTPGDPNKSWGLNFAAPPGEQLGIGVYPNAVRGGAPGQPGLDIIHGYSGCSQVTGEFTISDWELSGSTITALAVTFILHCEAETDTSRAELRIGSAVGLKAVVPYVGTLDVGNGVTGRPTAWKTLTVGGRGSVAATVSSVTLAGDNASDFSLSADTCTGVTLAPGVNCTVKVRMTAGQTWTRSARLIIEDDTFPAAHQVQLTGTGVAYAINAATLDFGSQQLGTDGQKTVTLANGLTPLEVGSIDISSGNEHFQTTKTCAYATVPALGNCAVVVDFHPAVVGAASGVLQWQLSGDYPQTTLKGVGVQSSKVAWGTDRTAGRDWTWTYGKALGRTVSGSTTYLHVIEATDYVGGKGATNSGPYEGVYYVRTSNAGSTWTTSLRLNSSTQHAERSALTASGANVYAAWVSQTKIGSTYSPTAARVLYVKTNTNHGSPTAWRSAVRVSSSTGRVDYPAIAASGSNVYLTYTDANTGNIRLAISRDRGATWTYKTIGTTTHSTSDGKAGYPAVAVSGSRVIVSWTLKADFKIVARTSVDSGATWAAQATVAMTAESESVAAASADRFAIGWTDVDGARVRTHKAGAWGAIKSITVNALNPYQAHWTPAIALNGTAGTAIAWGACLSQCDETDVIADLVWAESADGGSTFPYVQVVATTEEGNVWSPSIVWQKADARHVLYEKDCCGYDAYRLRIRTGTGAPK